MTGKVKCTCGWSWNKSDSSKKDMYICHECGRDNSNNMKNGGWLDNYGKEDNYNDSSVSAPEGFKGDGYSNVGRNYSPAWGGQFQMGGNVYPVNYVPQAQMGGSLPGATGHMYARVGAPSNGKYAKKTLASAQKGKTVKYGTPEYEEAYNKGEVITKEGVRSPILLDEVLVKGKKKDKNWLEQYADKIVDENKDAGVLGAILGTPISAVTSLPQLMGMKAFTGEMERPSEALDIENPYGAMAVDAIADPANLIGVGELSGLSKLTKEQALSKLANVKMSVSPELRQGLQTNGLLDIIKPSQNYVKGVKKLIPEGKKLKSRTSEELKKLELALSPNTVKALGRLDNNISEQMLQKYTWGEYATPKEFRLDVKKAILESERLKKINPSVDFSTDTFNDENLTGLGMDWLLSQPKYLSSFLDAKEVAKKTIQNKKEVKNFLEKSYTSKMDLINQDPILKTIAKESPQYTDLIYDHLKNPTKSTDEFVNDLVKQSNTFTRSMRKSIGAEEISKEDFFTPKGGSMGFANRNTIDVEGFPTSGDYGVNTYKIFPSAERMEDVANTPLEQRWDKRFPNTFPGNENIDFGIGLHSSVQNDFLHNAEVQRRLRNRNSVKYASGIEPKITKSEIIPSKYLYQPKHVVFNVPKNSTEMIKGFDVEQVGDVFNRFTPSGKFGSEPGYTHGFKYGGVIKDDMGQWAHPGEITEINSNDITMEGVPYDVLGISDTGDTKLMKPGKNYKFKGKKVTEYPMAKNGVNQQDEKSLQQLDQLTNFTNYNTKQPGGWLDTL